MPPEQREPAAVGRARLRPFWFEFEVPLEGDWPRGTRDGVGVTATDRVDALELIANAVFDGRVLPPLRLEIEDVAFHRLDPWQVLPNMVDPRPRGVWFPAGFGEPERAFQPVRALLDR
jgi:hypothetical protein